LYNDNSAETNQIQLTPFMASFTLESLMRPLLYKFSMSSALVLPEHRHAMLLLPRERISRGLIMVPLARR